MRNAVDRSLGWVVVTIIGSVSALLAFLIVRSEQWLFDIKEGHCTQGWWKARKLCCPKPTGSTINLLKSGDDVCNDWQTWAALFEGGQMSEIGFESWAIDYLSYTIIAVSVACSPRLVKRLTFNEAITCTFIRLVDHSFDCLHILCGEEGLWGTLTAILRRRKREDVTKAQSHVFRKSIISRKML